MLLRWCHIAPRGHDRASRQCHVPGLRTAYSSSPRVSCKLARAHTHTHTLSLPHTQITISNQGFDYTSGGVVKVFAYACALACKRARTLTVVYAHANLTCTNVCVSVGHSGRCDADGQSSVSGSHLLHQLEAVTVPLRRVHRPVESQSHIHLFV
jgi:hypothetical protein